MSHGAPLKVRAGKVVVCTTCRLSAWDLSRSGTLILENHPILRLISIQVHDFRWSAMRVNVFLTMP